MTDARTIALIARSPKISLDEAEDLIQQFAAVAASEAVASALETAHARTMAILEAPLSQETPHAQA